MSDTFSKVLAALAEHEGKSVEELQNEIVAERLGRSRPAPRAIQPARGPSTGDASGAGLSRREARERHERAPSTGSPVVRYDDSAETAAEAKERWYEEEAEMVDGVHGLGGSSAGGIFGGGPIATAVHDPEAHQRAESRVSVALTGRMLSVLERLESHLPGGERALPPTRSPKRLPR
jgi:hypothetical protein